MAQASGSVGVIGGKGFHQIYDPAAHLDVANLDEGAVELKPLRTAAEFDGESHRRVFGKSTIAHGLLTRGILEKKATGTLRMEAIACKRLAPTLFVPFSYFWIC